VLAGQRNAWLDSLRAFAILAVIACHITSSFHELHPSTPGGWSAVAGIGGHGVDLFFVLSGWLLGCVLLKEKRATATIDVGRFWKRRWMRTLPAYYAVLLLTLVQRVLQEKCHVSDLSYFIFIQNYAFASLPFLGISWSLCVEEQFYLLIAPLLLVLPSRTTVTTALVCLIVAPAIGRWWIADPMPWTTHLRIDACALGVLLAHLSRNYPSQWRRLQSLAPSGIAIGLGAITCQMVQRYHGLDGDLPLTGYMLFSGFLVVQSQATNFWQSTATLPVLRYIAIRSYSLYLVHIEAMTVARRIPIENFFSYVIFCVILSVLLAELLYRLVEKPWMDFRDRSGPQKSKAMKTDQVITLSDRIDGTPPHGESKLLGKTS